jgi:AcrR family transcriptional regulator
VAVTEKLDGRRERGDATRRRTARYAADLASVGGLEAVSVGRLATGTGLSKSGILTVFENREAIQLAAVAEARRVYVEHVVAPAWRREPGLSRLRGILDNWFAYVTGDVFPGGCFLVTTSVEYAAQEGPVAEAVRGVKQEWLDLLTAELSVALPATAAGRRRAAEAAFEIDALLSAANVRYRLLRDGDAFALARRSVNRVLRSLST